MQLDDQIFYKRSEHLEYIKTKAKDVVSRCPVVTVSSNMFADLIYKSLKSAELTVHNLKDLTIEKLEVYIQSTYLTKDKYGNYGVYLLNESLAVGTDIPTNSDIDRQGGSFLIIAEVLPKRTEE